MTSDDVPVPVEPLGHSRASRGFGYIEHSLLIVITGMTMAAAATETWRVIQAQAVNLADILLMFRYTEVVGMIAVFYTGRGLPFVYPIFIAITALSRLIVLQGKAMVPENNRIRGGSYSTSGARGNDHTANDEIIAAVVAQLGRSGAGSGT